MANTEPTDYYKNTREPFIIAEIGSNWKGKTREESWNNCIKCCNLAQEYGASAVKFQLFSHQELYGKPGKDEFAFPVEWVDKLATYCESQLLIKFMVSAFSADGFDVVNPHVEIHKVASSKVGDKHFMAKVADCDKPCLVSDGMFDVPVWDNIIPMLCASAYPAEESDYDLFKIWEYALRYPLGWGVSDHTNNATLAKLLRANGCSYFEKHVNFLGVSSPDNCVDIHTHKFGTYVDIIRSTPVKRPEAVKSEARKKWGDRWVEEEKGYFRPSGD